MDLLVPRAIRDSTAVASQGGATVQSAGSNARPRSRTSRARSRPNNAASLVNEPVAAAPAPQVPNQPGSFVPVDIGDEDE